MKELESVAYGEYDALAYVANVSQLVHATALFDTFLTECTRFLYMLHPGSMGKDHGVRVDDLLAATSKDDLIKKAATRKAREEAYGPFSDRLASLAKRYGLRLELDAETERQIAHYAGVRNAIVHDQAIFDLGFDDAGSVCVRKRTCPLHPTPVKDSDVKGAMRAYATACSRLARAVYCHVLKVDPEESLNSLLTRMCEVSARITGNGE